MAFERVIVEYPDGNRYGPTTLGEVAGWVKSGRMPAQFAVVDEATGERRPMAAFPELVAAVPVTVAERFFPKNNLAIVSYYLGFGSWIAILLFCVPGILVGGAAVVTGVKALINARRDPSLRGGAHAWTGIIMGAVAAAISLLGTIGLVMAFLEEGL